MSGEVGCFSAGLLLPTLLFSLILVSVQSSPTIYVLLSKYEHITPMVGPFQHPPWRHFALRHCVALTVARICSAFKWPLNLTPFLDPGIPFAWIVLLPAWGSSSLLSRCQISL